MPLKAPLLRPPVARQNEYLTAVAGVGALTLGCWLLTPVTGYGAIALIYLLGVLLAGMVLNRGPVLVAAALSALSWNFLFIPPLFTLHIAKVEDALMFLTYFIVAISVGSLTARLRAREHLAAQIQVAEESERLRKTLLDCVSHELKTPIAAISAASEALVGAGLERNHAEREGQLATEIRHASRRLTGVVDNLLNMTRLESGVIEPNREWCDVRDLLQSAVARERDASNARTLSLHAPDNLPLVLLDHGLIEQAVAKLVANAETYTPADAAVEVAARCEEGALIIAVSDHGPGLPHGQEEKMFEKFYRGDQTKTGGLGLGLSIARGFVEAHGGRLTATNLPDGGARFTITLPAPTKDPQSLDSGS